MTPEIQAQFPAIVAILKGGSTAIIRPLLPADGKALAAFYANVPEEDIRFYCPHPLDREHALRNAAKADSPFEVVLVLETPEKAIGGYAWYRWANEHSEKSTFGICISRPYQRLGAGRALMTRLLEIAKAAGPPVISLTVQLANPRAVKLYQDMGFHVVREQLRKGNPAVGWADEPEYYMELLIREQ